MKHRYLLALILFVNTAIFLLDVRVFSDFALPVAFYFIPLAISAYFISPQATLAVTAYATVLKLSANIIQESPIWFTVTHVFGLALVGYLSAELKARAQREARLAQEREELKIKAEKEAVELESERDRLAESEERFRSTFEQVAVGMAHMSLDGGTLRVNQKLCDILGYSRDHLCETRLQDLTHPDDPPLDEVKNARLLAGEIDTYSVEKRYVRADGSVVWTNATRSVSRDKSGHPRFVIGVLEDITERKESETLFRTLAESSPIGVHIVQDGRFRFVNRKFLEYTGYTESELLLMEALRLVLPEDWPTVRESAIRMLRGERRTPYEYRVVDKAGNTKWILETVSSIQYRGKRAVVGNFMDISERRELERQLAHMATHDPLTGLPNRRVLEDEMNRVSARARRGTASMLLFMDLDNFKTINDRLGHAAGDQALIDIVKLLRTRLREEDLLVRVGGDEFAVLLEGTSRDDVAAVAERYRQAVKGFRFVPDSPDFSLSLSIGAVAIDGSQTPAVLLSRADAAMYRAKELGGNCLVLHDCNA